MLQDNNNDNEVRCFRCSSEIQDRCRFGICCLSGDIIGPLHLLCFEGWVRDHKIVGLESIEDRAIEVGVNITLLDREILRRTVIQENRDKFWVVFWILMILIFVLGTVLNIVGL